MVEIHRFDDLVPFLEGMVESRLALVRGEDMRSDRYNDEGRPDLSRACLELSDYYCGEADKFRKVLRFIKEKM